MSNNESKRLNPATVQVSQQTMNYINCQRTLSDLYTNIVSAIGAQFGDDGDTSEKMFLGDFRDAFDAIDDALGRYVYNSIKEQQAPVESTTI